MPHLSDASIRELTWNGALDGKIKLLESHPWSCSRVAAAVSQSSMRPRDGEAQKGLAAWNRGGQPAADFAEQVFLHDPAACTDGRSAAVLHDAELRGGRGLALAIRFDPTQLPALFTWRMLGYGTYVMGIEPANCPTIEGRVKAEELGTLPFLEPGESRRYDLEFRILSEADAIAASLQRIPRRAGDT